MSKPKVIATPEQHTQMKAELRAMIIRFGGSRMFSVRFGLKYNTVCGWLQRGYIPTSALARILHSGMPPEGTVNPKALRPDIEW